VKLHCKPLLLLFIFFVPLSVAANEPVIWGYGHFPPYLYMREDLQPQGPYADIVKNIFKHAQLDIQAVHAPNRRIRQSINDGTIEFVIGPLTSLDNSEDFYISRAIVARIDLRVYWIGNQNAVTQASDLNGESVILIASFDYSGLRDYVENPDKKVNLAVNVEDHKRALMALSFKRGTYMLGYREPVDLMQLEMKIQDLHSYPIIQTDMYLILNKSVRNSRQIMNKLELAYSELYTQTVDSVSAN
jgi:polar amino acid transport system substrate-binding protein